MQKNNNIRLLFDESFKNVDRFQFFLKNGTINTPSPTPKTTFNVRSGTAVAATQPKFRLLAGVLGRRRDFVGQGRGGGVVRMFHVGVGAVTAQPQNQPQNQPPNQSQNQLQNQPQNQSDRKKEALVFDRTCHCSQTSKKQDPKTWLGSRQHPK